MISESTALERILAQAVPLPTETLPLAEACGRTCAADVFASLALPAFDHSAMDGYALHQHDCERSGQILTVTGTQPAGPKNPGLSVQPGNCVRIFTGGAVPAGTAAVLMQEDADRTGDKIRVREAAAVGEFIRRAGADLAAGQKILRQAQVLQPAALGVAASQGLATLEVFRRPRVVIASTGAELRDPGLPLEFPGQIYNSNGPLLEALLRRLGVADTVVQVRLPDDLDSLTTTFRTQLASCDALLVAGGMSVGDHDLARPALLAAGVAADFWKVSIKPGKPFLFGTAGSTLAFGLPGNPVSAFVTALLFVLPALRRMGGLPQEQALPCQIPARLAGRLENRASRTAYLRGVLDRAQGWFTPQGVQESHALFTLSQANALGRVEANAALEAGAEISVLPLW